MSNQWFRLYHEFANDPKVQSMPEHMQRRLIMLFCLRCSDDGIKLNGEELSCYMRVSNDEIDETKQLFLSKSFIDNDWNVLNWDKRQYISDKSNARVKKYREKTKSLGLSVNGYTKHSVTVTQRDGNKCVYCGSAENLCIDHILPIAQGGTDHVDNLACSCKACNSGKAGRTPIQAGYSFKNKDAENRWNKWLKSVTVTVTPPDTDTDTDTDTDIKKEESTSYSCHQPDADDVMNGDYEQPKKSNGVPPCPHQKIIDLYHEVLPELPSVRRWNGQRERNLASRWKETLSDLKSRGKPHAVEDGLDWFKKFFVHRVKASPLLMGQKGDWRASLPWLVGAEKFSRTLEGQYLEKKQ